MNSPDSIMNENEASTTTSNTSERKQSVVIEEYDATAAALSRLSVFAETTLSEDGASSRHFQLPSAYNTATPSSCPSPSKRGSEFFETSDPTSEAKRLRRDELESLAGVDAVIVNPFSEDFSLGSVTQQSVTQTKMLEPIFDTPFAPESLAADNYPRSRESPCNVHASSTLREHNLSTSRPLYLSTRRRTRSEPIKPSNRLVTFRTAKIHDPRHKQSNTRLGAAEAVQPAPERPPITLQTLKELELTEILRNAQLRHDMVHDPQLQFRPNTDGERGTRKRQEARKYWSAVEMELSTIRNMPASALPQLKLGALFSEMKEILLSLAPATEKDNLEGAFDCELLLQTINHEVFYAASFAKQLSAMMKRHCAPMRDAAVNDIVSKIEMARSPADLTEALRMTFDILELMKLDVANHQLQTLRGHLLSSSVEYEKNWFARKYDSRMHSRDSGIAWFRSLVANDHGTQKEHDYSVLFVGGLTTVLATADAIVPSTFVFDQGRISTLRRDISDLVYLNVVILLFKQIKKNLSEESILKCKSDLWSLVAGGKTRPGNKWIAARSNLALHVVKRENGPGGLAALPEASELRFAEKWLETNFSETSPIFRMIHSRILAVLNKACHGKLITASVNGHKRDLNLDWGVLKCSKDELLGISHRMSVIAAHHWNVHGSNYIQWSKQ